MCLELWLKFSLFYLKFVTLEMIYHQLFEKRPSKEYKLVSYVNLTDIKINVVTTDLLSMLLFRVVSLK